MSDVRALEHLKAHVGRAIDAFQEGIGREDGFVTADVAKAMIWRELEVCLSEKGKFDQVAWLRVSLPPDADFSGTTLRELGKLPVIAARCLGPRGGGSMPVWYVVTKAKTVAEAIGQVETLQDAGLVIRDWSFGCQRR